ncbi:hypothetical protein [Azospirillum sp. sgz302134]
MSADTEIVSVDSPMPVIGALEHLGRHTVRVTWVDGLRAGITEDLDLGPLVDRYRVYEPLADESLFIIGRLVEDGNVLRWDTSRGPIEMSATTVEHLAQLAGPDRMSAEQFRA